MKFSQTFLFDWIWLHNFSDFFGIGKTWCCSIKPSKWYENNLTYWNNQITGNLWHSICKDDTTWPGLVSQKKFQNENFLVFALNNFLAMWELGQYAFAMVDMQWHAIQTNINIYDYCHMSRLGEWKDKGSFLFYMCLIKVFFF